MPHRAALQALLQRFERERVHSFALFLWQRFRDDRCFESAGAMAYTTVFALVPLTAALFGVVTAVPAFVDWLDTATAFIFNNFVPAAARAVEGYLKQFAGSARGLTAAGAAALLVTAVLMLASVEDTFNRIWRVTRPRPKLARFLVYWTVLTLGPLLMVGGLAAWSYVLSLPLLHDAAQGFAPGERLLRSVPLLIELVGFTLAYLIIPNRRVALRHALAGGVLATLLFELAKSGFALYLGKVPSYAQIYGTLAVIPIFLIWIYLSWVVVLLGASFAASLSAFRFQPAAQRLPPGYEVFGLLRLLGRLAEAQRAGEGLHTRELRRLEPWLTDDLLQTLLGRLAERRVALQGERGEWVLSRDLDHLTLLDLYDALQLRIPVSEAWLPGREDAIGQAALAVLDGLRLPLRDQLRQRLGPLLEPSHDAAA